MDVQSSDPESTLSMYRNALAVRKEHDLGAGELEWLRTENEVLSFRNGSLTVVANAGERPLSLPDDGVVIIASRAVSSEVPPDTTVWIRHGQSQ
ncbi:MAG: hypothetical protein GEU79_07150 [Acidimicrobiia bacterium]|nr:hypothetical protein [Acidimicrobiia bacterium]